MGDLLLIVKELGYEPPKFKELKKESRDTDFLSTAYTHYSNFTEEGKESYLSGVDPGILYLEEQHFDNAMKIVQLLKK